MYVLLLFVPMVLLPMLVIGVILKLRRNRIRKMRKSPLVSDLLRPPGQHLREQLDALKDDIDTYLLMSVLSPTLFFALLVAPHQGRDLSSAGASIVTASVLVVGSVGYCLYRLLALMRQQDRLRIGYDAELAVAQELDQLMRQGAAVFHDFPAGKFNIDHIVISPVGVFAVETKGRAKPVLEKGVTPQVEYDGKELRFLGRTETGPIMQAERQAKWLRNWLQKAVGEPVAVRPVVAIPGWFVKRTARGGVNVYSGRELAGLVTNGGFDSLAAEKLQRIIHVVERECRNVAPAFNRTPKG